MKNVYSEQNVYGVINLVSLGSGCVWLKSAFALQSLLLFTLENALKLTW